MVTFPVLTMAQPSPSEQDLTEAVIHQLRERDPDAVEIVYRSLATPLYGYLLRQSRDAPTAQDLVADVFVDVIEGAHRFEGTVQGFRAWVFRIARNRMLDHFRKASKRQHDSLDAAAEAERDGLAVHWGRKVLEVRPPVEFDKGRAVRKRVERAASRAALFAGDDTTDLDAFDALRRLEEEGALDAAVLVGVRSDEGPSAIVERADVVVDGVDGFTQVLAALARP
jgi:trehalose-phosphatase